MTLQQITYMVDAIESGSISAAAEKSYTSRPTVSHALMELEEEFGCRLFNRSKSGISLTEIGNYFYMKCMDIKWLTDSLPAQMQIRIEAMESRKDILNIGVGPATSIVAFPHLYQSLVQGFPNLLINMMEHGRENAINGLRKGSMDIHLEITSGTEIPDYNGEFSWVKLFETELVFCIPPDHRLADKDIVTINEIQNEPLVARRSESYSAISALSESFSSFGLVPNIRFHSDILATIRSLIVNHMAYTFIIKGTLGDGVTILEKPLSPPQKYTCWVQYYNGTDHSKLFYKVLDYIRNMDKSVFNNAI